MNWHYFEHHAFSPSASADYILENALNAITRFSVPCFVMISGAFNLQRENNSDAEKFYKKTGWKIFIPVITAMIIFLFYDEVNAIIENTSKVNPIKSIIMGGFYNLWFLYMLAGLYLLTPLLVRLKRILSKKVYRTMTLLLMIWAVGSQAVSSYRVAYTIGIVFAFLGYYLMGDVILNEIELKRRPSFYFIISLLMFGLAFVARFAGITYYLFDAYTNFFSPFIVVASICVFAGTKGIMINHDWSWLSSMTFYIYIFHTLVFSIIFKFTDRVFGNNGEVILIPIIVVVTFIISLGIAVVYDKFWKSRASWKEKWYNLKIWNKIE